MPLVSGTRLGPYEILAPLGAGGMGEVYRARDTRLDRAVAIKVLPALLANDVQFRERFDREARAISQLTHSNICVLHDVGEEGPTRFLVMEYLEGETLEARLKKAALPMDQALRYGIELASALDAAHRAGITHRDLKPGNIMLTKSGAKLLDFGLAKALSGDRSPRSPYGDPSPLLASGVSMMPTTPANLTAQGTILGTFQYMAPEQIEGVEADSRTDIFAFGAVLYEMLTGRKAFDGKTQASLIAAILEREPPAISAIQPLTPPAIDHVVKVCLAKDPNDRWQTAGDLTRELKWIAGGGPQAGIPAQPARRGDGRAQFAWSVTGVLAVLLAIAIGAALFAFRRPEPEALITRFEIVTGSTAQSPSFSLSPDGRSLVFVANSDSTSKLWLRRLDQTVAQPLAGTDGANYPFWSPDSQKIAFFADGQLKRLDLPGSLPRPLAAASSGRGGAWNKDDVILFAPTTVGPIFRVPAAGGQPVQVTHPDQIQPSHRFPQFLPDGRQFVFFAGLGSSDTQGEFLASLDGDAPPKLLFKNDTASEYAPPGYLLTVQQGTLVARRFDPARAEVGEPLSVAQPVGTDGASRRGAFSVSQKGLLAHRGTAAGRRQLVWVDRAGKQIGSVSPPDDTTLTNPALDREGKRVAVQRNVRGNTDIWVFEAGRERKLTFDPALESAPTWSPKGDRIVFGSTRSGPTNLYEMAVDGSGTEQVLVDSPFTKYPLDWSRDGRLLLFRMLDNTTQSDIWALPMEGDRKTAFPVVHTTATERNGQFSPDGRWVAYDSNESNRFEVLVQAFPGPGGKLQASSGGGVAPRWRADGKELFYIASDGALMAVPIAATPDGHALETGTPVRLFPTQIVYRGSPPDNLRAQYDVAPDGQRFLIDVELDDTTASPITVVLNWMAGLKK